jgi:hypothetical protein
MEMNCIYGEWYGKYDYSVWGKWAGILNVRAGGRTAILCRLLGNRMKERGLDSFSSGYGPVVGCSDHYLQELGLMTCNCQRNGWRKHHNRPVCVLGYECGNFLTKGTLIFHVCVYLCSTWNKWHDGSPKYNNKSSILLLIFDVSIDSVWGL